MKKQFLFLVLTLVLYAGALNAGDLSAAEPPFAPKKYTETKPRFPLKSPVCIQVDEALAVIGDRIAFFLKEEGCSVHSGGHAKENIVIRKVNGIQGVPAGKTDAYSIRVTSKTVSIDATSLKAAQWAYLSFRQLYVGDQPSTASKIFGRKAHIKGCEIIDWDVNAGTTGRTTIDLTRQSYSPEELLKAVAKEGSSGKTQIYMIFISPAGWRIQSDIFRLINPNGAIHNGTCFSYADIKKINEYAAYHGIEIVPVFDFSQERNSDFERVTGHRLYSVEGMRFVRALLKEFCENIDRDLFCLGDQRPSSHKKYTDEMESVVRAGGKRVVSH